MCDLMSFFFFFFFDGPILTFRRYDVGRYVHKDQKYVHVEGPKGGKGPGAEKYIHQQEKYVPYEGGKHQRVYGTGYKSNSILHKCKELDKEGYRYQ